MLALGAGVVVGVGVAEKLVVGAGIVVELVVGIGVVVAELVVGERVVNKLEFVVLDELYVTLDAFGVGVVVMTTVVVGGGVVVVLVVRGSLHVSEFMPQPLFLIPHVLRQ